MTGPRSLLLRLGAMLSVATMVVLLADLDGGPRPMLVTAFLLTCPGLAIVCWIGVRDLLVESAVAVGASVATAVTVAQLSVWLRWWQPEAAVLLVAVASSVLLIAALRREEWGTGAGRTANRRERS